MSRTQLILDKTNLIGTAKGVQLGSLEEEFTLECSFCKSFLHRQNIS